MVGGKGKFCEPKQGHGRLCNIFPPQEKRIFAIMGRGGKGIFRFAEVGHYQENKDYGH